MTFTAVQVTCTITILCMALSLPHSSAFFVLLNGRGKRGWKCFMATLIEWQETTTHAHLLFFLHRIFKSEKPNLVWMQCTEKNHYICASSSEWVTSNYDKTYFLKTISVLMSICFDIYNNKTYTSIFSSNTFLSC